MAKPRLEWKPVLAVAAFILWGLGCTSPTGTTPDGTDGTDGGNGNSDDTAQQTPQCLRTVAGIPGRGYYMEKMSTTVFVEPLDTEFGQLTLRWYGLTADQIGRPIESGRQIYVVGDDGQILTVYSLSESSGKLEYTESAPYEGDLAFQVVEGCLAAVPTDDDLDDFDGWDDPNLLTSLPDPGPCGEGQIPLYTDADTYVCLDVIDRKVCTNCWEAVEGWMLQQERGETYKALGTISVPDPLDPDNTFDVSEGDEVTLRAVVLVEYLPSAHPEALGYVKAD